MLQIDKYVYILIYIFWFSRKLRSASIPFLSKTRSYSLYKYRCYQKEHKTQQKLIINTVERIWLTKEL